MAGRALPLAWLWVSIGATVLAETASPICGTSLLQTSGGGGTPVAREAPLPTVALEEPANESFDLCSCVTKCFDGAGTEAACAEACKPLVRCMARPGKSCEACEEEVASTERNSQLQAGRAQLTQSTSTKMVLMEVFLATLRSILTAMFVVFIGFVAAQQHVLTEHLTQGLSHLSVNFLMPCLLFSSLLACDQNRSREPCPNIGSTVLMCWPLLLLPFLHVWLGVLVGRLVWLLTRIPPDQRGITVCSVTFGNSTGLPVVLLPLIRASLPQQKEIADHDPMVFMTIYLVTYPVLLWGVGPWLMGKRVVPEHDVNNFRADARSPSSSSDVSGGDSNGCTGGSKEGLPLASRRDQILIRELHERRASQVETEDLTWANNATDLFWAFWQPPVIASLTGMLFAFTPARSWLVDTEDRSNDAVLEWAFNAIYSIGQTAETINLIIMGETLFATLDGLRCSGATTARSVYGSGGEELAAKRCTAEQLVGITVAKLMIMPTFGILTAYLMSLVAIVPSEYDASVYLVVMFVTAMPTTNNILMMASAAGHDTSMLGQAILAQFVAAPVLLTLTVSLFIYLATEVFGT